MASLLGHDLLIGREEGFDGVALVVGPLEVIILVPLVRAPV